LIEASTTTTTAATASSRDPQTTFLLLPILQPLIYYFRMATVNQSPMTLQVCLPAELKRNLDKYSVVMQRYKSLLKTVATNEHPPPLPAFKTRPDVRTLTDRIEVLITRCALLDRLSANNPINHNKQNLAKPPPHLRVLQEPPVGMKPTVAVSELEDADPDPQFGPSEQRNIMEVCSG
jgi:hypothetical protein